jgi:hypothetical protein
MSESWNPSLRHCSASFSNIDGKRIERSDTLGQVMNIWAIDGHSIIKDFLVYTTERGMHCS